MTKLIKKLNVLIADSQEYMRCFHKKITREAFPGYSVNVTEVKDGKEFYDMALCQRNMRNEYDLAITNADLPIITGLEAMRRLREKNVEMPTLVVTNSPEDENMVTTLDLRLSQLNKPYNAKELKAKLREMCPKHYSPSLETSL